MWNMKLKTDGVNFAWQKQNKRLFSSLKMQHTNVEDNTNARFVIIQVGYKVKDRQLKVFIEKIAIWKNIFDKKSFIICNHFV